MISLFLGLTVVNLLGLAMAMALGYRIASDYDMKQWHLLAGVAAAIICCAVHSVVFTYFIATSKWIQHAVSLKRLDPRLAEPTRSFKMQAFPAALLAIIAVFVAAMLGAARDNYGIASIWHWSAAWIAIAINLLVAIVEARAILRNGRLIDTVLDAARRANNGAAPASLRPV